jgi:lysophospholipase L1-like esterase
LLTHLVTIGDSWPAGAELQNSKDSFPGLIAEYLGVESINLSQPATSADQALHRLLNNNLTIDWKNTLVLFCLTGISRSMNIDIQPREIHPTAETPASVAYYKYIHSDELDRFNRIRNILAAQHYSTATGSRILFVNNWDKTPEHRAIDQSLFYNKTLTEILDIGQKLDDTDLDWYNLSKHVYIRPNQCHPNIEGHKLIATELSSWIKEKLNDKPVS